MTPAVGTLRTHDGLSLTTCRWNTSQKPRAILFVMHGLFEHCRRYSHVAEFFVKQGFHVVSYDQRGHGESEGLRGYVDAFSDFTKDLDQMLREVRAEHPELPVFLVAHSFGCAVSVQYLLTHPKHNISGLVTSAGAFQPGSDINPLKIKAAGFLSRFLPRFPVEKLKSGSTSRDPEVVQQYDEDPLVYRGAIRSRLGGELLKTLASIKENASQLTLPLLLMHGDADSMTEPAGTEMIYNRSTSEDKTLKMFSGFFHELFNEPEKEDIMNDVLQWLNARL
jgi:alpha-beta hydrolase superfamily lysophospholipase